jgi:diaminohydroxyphosphoribosylaminopyrimidine deaminase/5-amino-6-(5-phosphoribosylamino)uracil reductase
MSEADIDHMRRAIEISRRAPYTSPNPRVGAVLVRDGRVIGEAWHEGSGTAHAETIALAGVDAVGATMYLTLEPCTHRGHTGPCAPAVAAAGVGRVVVGLEDPDSRVAGNGVTYLRDRGVRVDTGVCEVEVSDLLAPYLKHRRTARAFLTLKLAAGLDGRIAAADGTSRWITGPETRAYVHARRVEADAVLIGAGTALADDPSLTARNSGAVRQPVRIVVDAGGRVTTDLSLMRGAGETLAPTRRPDGTFGRARHPAVIIATTPSVGHETKLGWKSAGAEIVVIPPSADGVDVGALLDTLGKRGFTEVLCEGGALLATSLLRAGLVDRLEIHVGGVLFGDGGRQIGDLGIETIADAPRWRRVSTIASGDDSILIYEPERG